MTPETISQASAICSHGPCPAVTDITTKKASQPAMIQINDHKERRSRPNRLRQLRPTSVRLAAAGDPRDNLTEPSADLNTKAG